MLRLPLSVWWPEGERECHEGLKARPGRRRKRWQMQEGQQQLQRWRPAYQGGAASREEVLGFLVTEYRAACVFPSHRRGRRQSCSKHALRPADSEPPGPQTTAIMLLMLDMMVHLRRQLQLP